MSKSNLRALVKKHNKGKNELSGFKYSIFDSIKFVPANIWNSVNIKNDIFLSVEYLTALENAPPENITFKYAILYEKNMPAGIAYFQIIALDSRLHENSSKKNNKFMNLIHNLMKSSIKTKILVCGNALLSGEHGFAQIPGMDCIKLSKGITEIIERLRRSERICRKINAIMIKDFYNKSETLNTAFLDAGYYDYFAGPNMVVPVRESWESFDDYLADMKTKYRSKVKSVLKKGSNIVKKTLDAEEIENLEDEFYKLYLQVANKAKFRLFRLNAEMLKELKLSLKEKFILDAYYIEDKLVAYTTRIINGEIMEGYSHGLDYKLNKTYELYQNILLDDIKEGIKRRMKKINFGRTSIAMKSAFGAVPEELRFLMQFKMHIPNHLIKALSSFTKPDKEECRNPFTINEGNCMINDPKPI